MFGNLTPPEITALLKKQLIGRLACCAAGVPYVVPISYAFADPFIYSYTYEGKKTGMLRQNPHVCFEVSDTTDLANWQSVICHGTFEELATPEEKQNALRILNNRPLPFISSKTMQLSPEWPFTGEHAPGMTGIFFRIHIHEMSGRYEKADAKTYFAS